MRTEMSTMPNPTPAEFRARFPALGDTAHLASCSHGALSDTLATAMLEYQRTLGDDGVPWDRWIREVDTARRMFADHIGAAHDEIAVVSCASEAAFQVASTQDWAERPRIVTTDMEFPSVAHVWLAQQRRGADVVHVADRDGVVPAEDYNALIDGSCGLVSIPLISYRNGVRLPVEPVVSAARAAGARVFIDAYQAVGVEPVDVTALGCDYLVSGSLKYLLGIPGIAFLYVRSGVVDAVAPQLTGWFGRVEPFAFDPRQLDFPAHARRFETGTPSVPSAFGAVAGMRVLAAVDPAAVTAHVAGLATQLHERLVDAGERIGSPADAALRGPQVAVRDEDPDDLAAFLAARRIVTSPRGDLLRLSLHYYNNPDDLDAVVAGIRAYRATKGSVA
ncbi:MAG: aminotransferase class V-fold PLP-dependent enzyme [Micromonosporaceae bacterium]